MGEVAFEGCQGLPGGYTLMIFRPRALRGERIRKLSKALEAFRPWALQPVIVAAAHDSEAQNFVSGIFSPVPAAPALDQRERLVLLPAHALLQGLCGSASEGQISQEFHAFDLFDLFARTAPLQIDRTRPRAHVRLRRHRLRLLPHRPRPHVRGLRRRSPLA